MPNKYIDMRLRPPLPTWVGKANFAKGIFYPVRIGFERPPSAEARSMDMLLREMDEAEIEYGVIMGRQSIEPLGAIPNDEIIRQKLDCLHNNPVKRGLVAPPEHWRYSSALAVGYIVPATTPDHRATAARTSRRGRARS